MGARLSRSAVTTPHWIREPAMAGNDDFDDLFRAPSSSTSASNGLSFPSSSEGTGFGGFDEDATSNPFADLQSSRLMVSSVYPGASAEADLQQASPGRLDR